MSIPNLFRKSQVLNQRQAEEWRNATSIRRYVAEIACRHFNYTIS
jgi:hypothetical protein